MTLADHLLLGNALSAIHRVRCPYVELDGRISANMVLLGVLHSMVPHRSDWPQTITLVHDIGHGSSYGSTSSSDLPG